MKEYRLPDALLRQMDFTPGFDELSFGLRPRVMPIKIRLTDYTIGSIREDTHESIFLHIDDVVRIEEHPGKGLVVRSAGSARHVDVPAEITGYSEIRERLAKWRPIDVVPR